MSNLPPDPSEDTSIRHLVDSENQPILDTSVANCQDGVDPSTEQPTKVCDVCYISAGVIKKNDDSLDIAAFRKTGTLQFRYAISADQPQIMPAKKSKGVWAIERSSLRMAREYERAWNSQLSNDVGFQQPEWLQRQMRTYTGDYITPGYVRDRLINDPAIASRFVTLVGGCPVPPQG